MQLKTFLELFPFLESIEYNVLIQCSSLENLTIALDVHEVCILFATIWDTHIHTFLLVKEFAQFSTHERNYTNKEISFSLFFLLSNRLFLLHFYFIFLTNQESETDNKEK